MAYIEFKDVSKVYRMGQTEIRALDHIKMINEYGGQMPDAIGSSATTRDGINISALAIQTLCL